MKLNDTYVTCAALSNLTAQAGGYTSQDNRAQFSSAITAREDTSRGNGNVSFFGNNPTDLLN